jgi:hypothetical protein
MWNVIEREGVIRDGVLIVQFPKGEREGPRECEKRREAE